MYIKKYDSSLINKYINEEKTPDYNIYDLQNDEAFMSEVIMTTHNKEYYRRCSDNLKKNQKFVLFVVETFIDDEKFVSYVVENYFNETTDEINRGEMQIKLAGLSDKYDYNYLKEYASSAKRFYLYEKSIADMMLDTIKNPNWKKELGTGFKLYMEFFKDSNLITFYMASNVLEELLPEETIENELHKKYDKQPNLNNMELYTYIISIVNKYDHFLADYLELNVHAMDFAVERLKKAVNEWDKYDAKKITKIIEEIYVYLNSQNKNIDKDKLLIYLVNNRGYNDKFLKNDKYVEILRNFYSYNPNIDYSNMELIPDELFLVNGMDEIIHKYLHIDNKKSNVTYVDFSKNK